MSADRVFELSTWVGVVALTIGVVCSALIAISGKIRDDSLKLELSASAERVAAAELKTEQLRKQLGPRQIQRDLFLKAIEGQPQAHVEIVYLRDDPECFDVAQQIWRVLQDAKWEVVAPVPIPQNASIASQQNPTAISVDGQPSGVTVVTHSVSEQEAEAGSKQMLGVPWERTPWTVLMNALNQSLGRIGGSGGGSNSPPEGTLRVVVAPR
ncbi:hypothetical protein [Collimonas sp.]|uniref:hypothetical protein n=1 Tax=Collimonas sp. TaxID=1963772 RepID=UPI002C8CC77C|nr:hypothetical protein [Collimonas sp.]HWW05064.1 hypothetical protein [Collimonas sp.]